MRDSNKMADDSAKFKPIVWIIPSVIIVLLIGAVLFYKERMLFIDAPHILFRVVNDGRLHIEENRFGSFITQMFPLLGAKLHLPFKLLVVLYSASFYLFYLVVAVLIIFRYKNYGLAVLLGFYLTLLVSDTYYWPNNEVHQGIAWLLLGYAMLLNNLRGAKYTAWIVMALAIWTHPLVMFVAVYLWLFHLLSFGITQFTTQRVVLMTVILLSLSFLKYYQSSHHGYDNTKIEVAQSFDFFKIGDIFSGPVFLTFLQDLIREYWLFTLLFIWGLSETMRRKKYLLTLFVSGYALSYLLLVCMVFNGAETVRFHLQSEYMPLTIICCAPFAYFLLPRLNTKVTLMLLLFIFLVRFCYIYAAAEPFAKRIALLDAMNNKMKEKGLFKIVVPEPVPESDSALIVNWGATVESIMLSKLKNEQPQRTFIFADSALTAELVVMGKDTVMGCWQRWGYSELNKYYFQQDTTTRYQVVRFNELMK